MGQTILVLASMRLPFHPAGVAKHPRGGPPLRTPPGHPGGPPALLRRDTAPRLSRVRHRLCLLAASGCCPLPPGVRSARVCQLAPSPSRLTLHLRSTLPTSLLPCSVHANFSKHRSLRSPACSSVVEAGSVCPLPLKICISFSSTKDLWGWM